MTPNSTPFSWKRRANPHAQIHLPPLTAHQALLLCNLMDRAITALWRTHGEAMMDILSNLSPEPGVHDESAPAAPAPNPPPDPDDIF